MMRPFAREAICRTRPTTLREAGPESPRAAEIGEGLPAPDRACASTPAEVKPRNCCRRCRPLTPRQCLHGRRHHSPDRTVRDHPRTGAGESRDCLFWPAIRRLNREIALKVPRPEAILTPQLRSRFLREGKAAARLNHPNILPVHEAGEAGPICYLVQSYCSGPSLAAWSARRRTRSPATWPRDRGRAGRRRRSRTPAGHSAPRHQTGQCDA